MNAALFPPQQEVLDHGILDLGFSSVISLPTGAGKTTLAEIAIDKALARREKAVYLTPLKAIADEKVQLWKERWPEHRVGIFTGDYTGDRAGISYEEAQVMICTYERLDGVIRAWRRHLGWLSKLGVVIVDEFHLLIDETRGPRLEGTLSRLHRINPFCRIMGLSATVSNHAELATWLGGVSYHSTWRPVPLSHEVRRFKRPEDKPVLIGEIVSSESSKGGQSLVFASSRRRAEGLATTLRDGGLRVSHHHAGLGMTERRQIEADFREGRLDCIVATPTLEMGLNLPCRIVVIADHTRWDGESFSALPVWNYLQRAGRAGRPGQDSAGRAILLAPTWARKFPNYDRSPPEPVRSQLHRELSLAEQVLVEIASGCCRTREELEASFLKHTLAHIQHPHNSIDLEVCVARMLAADFIEQDSKSKLRATPIGWTAVREQLSPSAAMQILSLRTGHTPTKLSNFDLLLHHCWSRDLQPRLPASIEIIDHLEELICDIPSLLLDTAPPEELAPRVIASGVLMATLCWAQVEGRDLEALCAPLDVYPTDAYSLVENLVRLLNSSAALVAAYEKHNAVESPTENAPPSAANLRERLTTLAMSLQYGLPGNAVSLTRVPGCGGMLARRLFDAGITDLEDLALEEPEELAKIRGIGKKRATEWNQVAQELVKDWDPLCENVPAPRNRQVVRPSDWPVDIDPGRLRRAIDLTVVDTGGQYLVTGGADIHHVDRTTCDCADFREHDTSWWCKHRLAVRIAKKDPQITQLAARLGELDRPNTVAGHLAELTLGRTWRHE
jgi:helicase